MHLIKLEPKSKFALQNMEPTLKLRYLILNQCAHQAPLPKPRRGTGKEGKRGGLTFACHMRMLINDSIHNRTREIEFVDDKGHKGVSSKNFQNIEHCVNGISYS